MVNKVVFSALIPVFLSILSFGLKATGKIPQYQNLQQMRELVFIEPMNAIQKLESLRENLELSNRKTQALWHLLYVQALNNSYHFDEYEKTLKNALTLISGDVDLEVKSLLMTYQGISLHRKGEFQESINVLRDAAAVGQEAGSDFAYVLAQVELTYALSLAEQLEFAMLEVQKAYIVASKLNNDFLSGLLEEVNATLMGYRDEYDGSIESYLSAANYYAKVDYPYYLGESAYGIASTYRYAGELEKAHFWYDRYLKYVDSFNSTYTYFFYNYGKAMTYAAQGNCTYALNSITAAISVVQFKDYKAELYKQLSRCLGKYKDFVGAEAALDQAKIIYQEIPELNGTSWSVEVEMVEAELLAYRGEFDKAYERIRSYYEQLNEIKRKSMTKRLDKLKIAIQAERQNMEMNLFDSKARLYQAEMESQLRKNQVQKMWLMAAVLCILLMIAFGLYQLTISKKLKRLSITDELTGLKNRRFIFDTIKQVLEGRPAHIETHSVLLMDLDCLKQINDSYGHHIGDTAIKEVARLGLSILREGDVFARIGGDEFMILLSRVTSNNQAPMIAGRLLEQISDAKISTDTGNQINLSVSIGVAHMTRDLDSPTSIYSRADQALYQAKRDGKGRVSVW
ncbi:GGDEF domain-containing protein [Aliikangiella sp. G2MR2-5]|uniref:GGDEF domain-containing protein n=1 Tax=Aliikangiella sp. G2MR2-5 TaxID=2788943 RepID=UPI0018AC5352|nr:GGDEF domain-containing protein [Aliikangiella sp. G2MR2-5]